MNISVKFSCSILFVQEQGVTLRMMLGRLNGSVGFASQDLMVGRFGTVGLQNQVAAVQLTDT